MPSKQLSSIDAKLVSAKVETGFPLTLKELAIASGYSYEIVRRWKGRGLPILDGKITFADFLTWKNRCTGLDSEQQKPSKRETAITRTYQEPPIDDVTSSFLRRLKKRNRSL